jgi:hypothetical protein
MYHRSLPRSQVGLNADCSRLASDQGSQLMKKPKTKGAGHHRDSLRLACRSKKRRFQTKPASQ